MIFNLMAKALEIEIEKPLIINKISIQVQILFCKEIIQFTFHIISMWAHSSWNIFIKNLPTLWPFMFWELAEFLVIINTVDICQHKINFILPMGHTINKIEYGKLVNWLSLERNKNMKIFKLEWDRKKWRQWLQLHKLKREIFGKEDHVNTAFIRKIYHAFLFK